jgi:L-cystine uptake protein TcyP (sodium:dicarboxylate symporter family)
MGAIEVHSVWSAICSITMTAIGVLLIGFVIAAAIGIIETRNMGLPLKRRLPI